MNNNYGAFVVSWDFSRDTDNAILLVGSKENGIMEIVNTFRGKEAIDIYEKLSKKKETKNG